MGKDKVLMDIDGNMQNKLIRMKKRLKKIITNDGSKGGMALGDAHSAPSGGITTIVKGTGQKVLIEGNEPILSDVSMSLKDKYVCHGTPKGVVSSVNELGGGNKFAEEGEGTCQLISEAKKGRQIKKRIKENTKEDKPVVLVAPKDGEIFVNSGSVIINKKNMEIKKRVKCFGTPQGIASSINTIHGNGVEFSKEGTCEFVDDNEVDSKNKMKRGGELKKVAMGEKYDYYIGKQSGKNIYNIVPKGSQPPMGGYYKKEHILNIKRVDDLFENKNQITNKMETGNKKRLSMNFPTKRKSNDIAMERGGINVKEKPTDSRIDKMVDNWEKEGRAFSNISNNDGEFFERIGIDYEKIGTTSQTGNDIVYYDTNIYQSGHNALRGIKHKKSGGLYSEGGLVPQGTPQKYKNRDKKYYSYLNPDVPYEISHHRVDDFGERGIMHHYKLSLRDKDGYSYSSKWIAESSLSEIPLTKETQFLGKGGSTEESKQVYWTLPKTTPVHNQPNTKIIIERNEKPIGELGHTGKDLYLYRVYLESPDGNKYWITPSLTEDKAKKRAEELKYTIESGYKITELIEKSYTKK